MPLLFCSLSRLHADHRAEYVEADAGRFISPALAARSRGTEERHRYFASRLGGSPRSLTVRPAGVGLSSSCTRRGGAKAVQDDVLLAVLITGLRPALHVFAKRLSSRLPVLPVHSAVGLRRTMHIARREKPDAKELLGLEQILERMR